MLPELSVQGVRDRAFFLRSLPSFAPLDDDALGLIAAHTRVRSFRAGARLIEDTAPMTSVYVLLSGRVRVTYEGALLAISERPRGVGLLAARAGKLTGTAAVAMTDTTALELPLESLRTAHEENFGLVRNDLRLCAGGLLDRFGGLPVSQGTELPVEEGRKQGRPLTLVERVLEMRHERLFAAVNLEAVLDLARRGEDVRYESGDRLWRIGELSDHYVRIDSGRVRCTASDGRNVDVASGQVLGSFDALATRGRSFEATAITPVMGFRTGIQALLTVMETQHELARGLMAILATSLLEAQIAGHQQPGA